MIGVYEPMVVITPDGRRASGGQLTLRSELAEPGSVATHAQCDRADAGDGACGSHRHEGDHMQ